MIDPDDERTTVSRRNDPARRKGAAPAPVDDELDDRTQPSRRSSVGADAGDPGSARWAVPSDSEVATQAATESAPAGPRRTAHPPAPEPPRTPAGARHAASPAPPTPEPATPSPATPGRVAAPPASAAAAYRARPIPPVTAVRAEPVHRAPQDHVDTAAADATRRSRRRRRTIAVAVAASVLVIVAALALVALLTTV